MCSHSRSHPGTAKPRPLLPFSARNVGLSPAAALTETPTFDPRWAGGRGSGALDPPARQPRLDAKIADHDRQVVDECAGERILVQGWHGERPRSGTNTGQQDDLSLKGGGDSGSGLRAAREDQAAAGQGDTFALRAGERARRGRALCPSRTVSRSQDRYFVLLPERRLCVCQGPAYVRVTVAHIGLICAANGTSR